MSFLLPFGLSGVIFAIGFLTCYAILKAKGRLKGAYDDDIQAIKTRKTKETWMSLKTVLAKVRAGESEKYLLSLSKEMDEHLGLKENL